MINFKLIILNLTKRLYPTGRAFRVEPGSWREALYKGLNKSEEKSYKEGLTILSSILPDNDAFDENDAKLWERRLGIYSNDLSPLVDRKKAIKRKMNHPGKAKARQHYLYLQGELQKAGFDVYIHENIFQPGNYAKNPIEILGSIGAAFHSENLQHGQTQLGRIPGIKVIANSISQEIDDNFNWQEVSTQNIEPHSNSQFLGTFQHTSSNEDFSPSEFRNIFYIGGEILGNYANIPADREIEFRQLILSLKPVQNIGVLLINYI